ncbi:MAG: hypothetical protein QG597_2136 [Actinomycetota bacterium]|nr:hypothetical protein [Actinomycetota bacterium]
MLLVIFNHLLGWPTGGFIGVDVFFVVSGFLITGLLLREKESTGTFSFREFYARRMRRIFPMATLVLVVTVAASYVLYFADQADQTLLDALWAFVFLENWHLAAVGTDYFHLADGASPVQQYWSLSVEEQFYLLWPAVLWGLWAAGRRWLPETWHRFKGLRRGPAIALAVLCLASFGWAVQQTADHPTQAYFSTFTRAWELGLGALLAVVAPLLVQLPARMRAPMAYGGLAAIGLSALLLTQSWAFPGPWAALPVLGTVAVIASGTGGAQPKVGLLHSAGAQLVGRLSYSLYLWHFPVIAFLFVVVAPGPMTYALALAITLALSVASFYRIEEPIRRSDWLSRRPATDVAEEGTEKSASSAPAQSWRRRALNLATIGVLGAALVLTAQHNLSARVSPAAAATEASTRVDLGTPVSGAADGAGGFHVTFPDAQGILTAHLQAATVATSWPELQLPEEWDDWSLPVNAGNCSTGLVEARYCVFETPGATKTAVLFGDSHVAAWFPALRPGLEEAGYRIEVYYLVGCPVADVPIHHHTVDAPENSECADFRADAIARVAAAQPDLTVVSSFWKQVDLSMSGATGAAAEQEWHDGMVDVLRAVAPNTRDLLVLDSPPGAQSLKKCRTAVSAPQDCQRQVQELGAAMSRVNSRAVAVVHATLPHVRHRPVEEWFCAAGVCPAFMADIPIYTDGIHIAPAYGASLAPLVKGALKG